MYKDGEFTQNSQICILYDQRFEITCRINSLFKSAFSPKSSLPYLERTSNEETFLKIKIIFLNFQHYTEAKGEMWY